MLLFFQKYDEAEKTLLKSKEVFRAVMLNIDLFRWERALALAQKGDPSLPTAHTKKKKDRSLLIVTRAKKDGDIGDPSSSHTKNDGRREIRPAPSSDWG